ncbi:MAG: efflux RND transporter periplasmic adaptor subunit [Nitrospirota bacterium]|nr:efflux RND transporter periplasmic adaptor subunit [Nitrospirota bacterium]
MPVVVLSVLVVMSALSACSKAKQAPPRVAPVLVETADRKNVPLQLKAIGNVEAYNTVAVKSQVSGEISEVFFREGQDVRVGTLLFRIDPRPFESVLRQAESALARDRAQARNAAEESKRYEQLSQKGFVSRQEYDRARTNADALNAVVQVDEAAVENARLQLEYTAIMSPITGRTGAITVQKGNVVKANDISLVTINQVAPVYVTFSMPEQDLAAIRKYKSTGELHVEAVLSPGAKPISGTLTFLDNKVNTATGTILLKATFPNQDHALWPGQFVDVVLTLTTEKDRVVVPSPAIQTGQQGQFLFVVKEDMTAEMRPVTVVRTFDRWAVIDKGVQPGETVVTDGQIRIAPGAKVEIKNAEQETEKGKGNHGGTETQRKTKENERTQAVTGK